MGCKMANWTSIPCEVEILGLETILSDAGIEPPFNDFESVYATLSEDKDKAEVARLLEETVYHYSHHWSCLMKQRWSRLAAKARLMME